MDNSDQVRMLQSFLVKFGGWFGCIFNVCVSFISVAQLVAYSRGVVDLFDGHVVVDGVV